MTKARPGTNNAVPVQIPCAKCGHNAYNCVSVCCDLLIRVQAAQGAGMLSVAVPPALSARGRFPAAQVTFDGFGYGGGLNWPRLQMLLDKRLAGKF